MTQHNNLLGTFNLTGIPPAPRGVPKIEVTFDIDANGILNVSAKDKGTGKQQRITITASSGLTQDEIERMVREAESHAEEDRRKREEIQQRNMADNAAYTADKLLRENADKIPADLKSEIEGKISALRSALQGQDIGRINLALQDLQTAMQKVGQIVYSQTGGQAQGGGGQGKPPEGTVEGEYREV